MQEPFTPIAEGMSAIHELYLSLRRAGFTRVEACIILGVFIAQSASNEAKDE